MNMPPDRFAWHTRRSALDLHNSVVLRHADGRLIGIAFLAVRGRRGWCGGFGIVTEFRGQGLGHRLAREMVARARQMHLASLQLEVLVQNTRAIQAYQAAGMMRIRDVARLEAERSAVRAALGNPALPGVRFESLTPEEALRLETRSALETVRPVWQREPMSLLANGALCAFAAFDQEHLVALLHLVPNATSGSIHLERFLFRDPRYGRVLLAHALDQIPSPTPDPEARPAQIFLGDELESTPLYGFLTELGMTESLRQHEMWIEL
jgi:hypothetical protein